MPELTPLAKKIADLNELRSGPDIASKVKYLREGLADRSSHVVRKSAELSAELGKVELRPELLTAYARMFVNPLKKDPGCLAKTAIAEALVKLDCQDIDSCRQGIRYQQYEPVWGGQQDTAAQLRAVCAVGMLGCATCMEAINAFADLLADPCKPARIGAARAISGLGSWEGVPLLRLKLQLGDEDAEVVGECCSALLAIAPDDGVDLVTRLLSSKQSDLRIQAALALGESRSQPAFEPLCACWQAEREPSLRGMLLTCIGLLRSTESREFLVSLIRGPDATEAADAIQALAPYSMIDEVCQQVADAVKESAHRQLRATFEKEFKPRQA